MKIIKITALLFPILTFMPQLAKAQQMRTMSFDASSSIILTEFHAILIVEENALQVEMKMGHNEAQEGIDQLERGDIVLMMNGKRTNDIVSIREIYESVDIDSEIKIGVRRGEQRFILKAIKGAVPEAGGMQMVMTMDSDDSSFQPTIVPALGAVLTDNDGKVKVEKVIPPFLPDELKGVTIEGFFISELNGNKPETAASVKEILEDLEVGAEISITFSNENDAMSITFKKAEPKGDFSFSTDN